MKLLTLHRARSLELLSQFLHIVRYHAGKLGTKPDVLTRQWDVYPKEGDSDYARVNPQNFHPVFSMEQLMASLQATYLLSPVLRASSMVDVDAIHKDILSALPSNPSTTQYLSAPIPADSHWSLSVDGLLRLDNRIYIPDVNDLCLRILRYKHDHPLSRHFGQAHTLDLIQ